MNARLDRLERAITKLIPKPTYLEIELDGQPKRMTVPAFLEARHDFFQARFAGECSLKAARMILDSIPANGIE